jgi:hypothetical protein
MPSRSPTTAIRTNERMWQSIKRSVLKSTKGGVSGKWSARKAQIATRIYKSRGGKYKGRRSPQNSLTRWSKQQWRYSSAKNSKQKRGRYLPSIVHKHLSSRSRNAENRRKGSKRGTRVKYGSEVKRLMKKYRIYSSSKRSTRKLKCWKGYKRVPGTRPGAKGSCRKI